MNDAVSSLRRIVGERHVITDRERGAKYTEELRGRYPSECLAVVLPGDREQVSEVVRCCAAAGVSMVPQGGNTGAMGGAVAHAGQVIVNLERMNRVLELDAVNHTLSVQAGCILADVQAAAREAGLLFPLSLGAQGSCQIGGNLATNAGGINVLHYGNARDLALGLEVVLADGSVLDCMNKLRKNNTGYDFKNLFIGAEGTLGVITAAVLKLFPCPHGRIVFMAGCDNVEAALELLARTRSCSSDRLVTCELMSQISVQTALAEIPGQKNPFADTYAWYVLAVVDSSRPDPALESALVDMLCELLEKGVIGDATVAGNESQQTLMIQLREDIVEAQKSLGGSIKHDVSVPVSRLPEFMARVERAVRGYMPEAVPYPYAHLGDGNVHFNISQPPDVPREAFLEHWQAVNDMVHDITHELGGSFSAEHGVGITKLDEMEKYKGETELRLARGLKTLLDPGNIMNPGKVTRLP